MNSREFDGMLDDLLRQAFYPFAEAEPSLRVWRRVLRAVRSLRTERAVLAGLPATFSRWLGFFSWMGDTDVTYVPWFSNRSHYVDPTGRCLHSPFWDITLRRIFDLRLAS